MADTPQDPILILKAPRQYCGSGVRRLGADGFEGSGLGISGLGLGPGLRELRVTDRRQICCRTDVSKAAV